MFRKSFLGMGLLFGALFSNLAFGAEETLSEAELREGFRKSLESVREKIGAARFEEIADRALQEVQQGNFANFDPVVGDTSCELRALFGVLATRNERSESSRNLIALIHMLSYLRETSYSEDGFNLHPRGGENKAETLGDFNPQISNKVRKSLLVHLQRAVAYGSVIFAREEAARLQTPTGRALVEVFRRQTLLDSGDFERPVVSMFGIVHLSLELAKKYRFPILVRLRLASEAESPSLGLILIAYVWDGRAFVRTNLPNLELTESAFVIDAMSTEFESEFLAPNSDRIQNYIQQLNIENALLLDAALHPQFAGPANRVTPLYNPETNAIARQWWNLRRGLRTFRVDHVYVNTVRNILSLNAQMPSVDLVRAFYLPVVNTYNSLLYYALLAGITYTSRMHSK